MKTPPRTTQRWALSRLPPPGEGTSPVSGLPNGKRWGPGGLRGSSQVTELGLCVLRDAPGTRSDPRPASLWDRGNILGVQWALCAAETEGGRRYTRHPARPQGHRQRAPLPWRRRARPI